MSGASESVETLLSELERFGESNDEAVGERPRRMLNITRDTGQFLEVLVRATLAQRVLEIGTSNGYSTLWLARAAQAIGGAVTTVERSDYKARLARENFARSGLSSKITLLHEDTQLVLARSADAAFDLIFLDAERTEYPSWWLDLRRVLRPGGLLVVDNAIAPAPEQLAPFIALIEADAAFTTSLVPVGKGEFLAVKAAR